MRRKFNLDSCIKAILKFAGFSAIGLGGIIICTFTLFSNQQTDPFYYKLLRDGENSFLAKEYREAIKELEIAAFGLYKEKKLLGKAYVYLGLSHYHLKDKEKCVHYLKSASELLGEDELETLDIREASRSELKKLLDELKLRKREEKGEPPKGLKEPKRAETKTKPAEAKISPSRVKELENRIKSRPHSLPPYYELYEFHSQKGNVQEAKKVLQKLLKNNPNEVKAVYLLARIDFSQKKYKTGFEGFEKVLKPSRAAQIDKELKLKSLIYLCLCLSYLDKKQSLLAYFNSLPESASVDELQQMLKEEGLEEEWNKMKAQLSKRLP